MASSLPDLSHLAAHPSVPTGAVTSNTMSSAYIYVVADMLGDEEDRGSQNDRLLFLYRGDDGSFGVPGGNRASGDGSGPTARYVTAKRHFAQMVLGLMVKSMDSSSEQEKTMKQRTEAMREIMALNDNDRLETLQEGSSTHPNPVGRYCLRVQRTSTFEAVLAKWNPSFNPSASVDVKRATRISGRMEGYVWVRESAIAAAVANLTLHHALDYLQVRDTDGGVLYVRNGVVGNWPETPEEWKTIKAYDKLFP